MNQKKSVLLIGWDPDFVDYSKWPGLTPEKLRKALELDRDKLNSIGYEAKLGLIENAETAPNTVVEYLKEKQCDCVLIGAGVRTIAEYFLLFEQLINTVNQHAPNSKICFNTGPTDSVQAVQRWV